jgi:hypothetical protein
MRPLKSLTLESVIATLSATFLKIGDGRDPAKVKYALHDVLMSGFAMMFFHHPSLLQYQERMKQKRGISNLETIFQVNSVPSDTQTREILDEVSPESLRQLLPKLFEKVRRAGWAEQYKTSVPSGKNKGSYYTMPLDGMEYFHSTEIQCPGCLQREDSKSGQTSYSHYVVGATLVKAGSHRILPLDVEEVRNTDGQKKQDCEINAGKRLTERVRKEHPQLPLIVMGDDLYSHEPFVESLIEKRMHFVLVAKPESHQELIEWVEELDRQGECVKGTWEKRVDGKRRIYEYRIAEIVPLKANGKVDVNYVEVWERDQNGKLLYHNSWVTDLDVDAENVEVIVRIGRSRWKIENEQFNIHKNHGYEIEHNYGHGEKNLSMVFYLLNLLAFVTHLILEFGDRLYQKCRKQETLRETWLILRTLMRSILFDSWNAMLLHFLDEKEASP